MLFDTPFIIASFAIHVLGYAMAMVIKAKRPPIPYGWVSKATWGIFWIVTIGMIFVEYARGNQIDLQKYLELAFLFGNALPWMIWSDYSKTSSVKETDTSSQIRVVTRGSLMRYMSDLAGGINVGSNIVADVATIVEAFQAINQNGKVNSDD